MSSILRRLPLVALVAAFLLVSEGLWVGILNAIAVRAYAHVATTSDPADDPDPGEYTASITAGETAIWFWQTDDDAATTDLLSPSDSFENNTTVTFAGTYQLHMRLVCASTGGSTTLTTDDPGTANANFMGVSRYTGVATSACIDEALTGISSVNVSGGSVDDLTCAGSVCLGWGVLMTNRNPTPAGTQRHEDTNGGLGLTYNVQEVSFSAGDNDLTWTFDTDGVYTAAGVALEEASGGAPERRPCAIMGGYYGCTPVDLISHMMKPPTRIRHVGTKIWRPRAS